MASFDRLRHPFGRSNPVTLETKDAVTTRASSGSQYAAAGVPYSTNWNVDRAVRDGYEKVIVVFKAIDAIAMKLSGWHMLCVDDWGSKDAHEVDDSLLPVLNGYANLIDGPAQVFRHRLATQLILSKAGVFVEANPTRGGDISSLTLLPAGRTRPIPDRDTFISGFEVTLPDGDRQILPPYDPKTRKGVVWIGKKHPLDPYSCITPLEAAGLSIDLDFYARLYNRNFLLNDGRSGQIIAVKGGLSPEDAAEIKARTSPGISGAGRTSVIEADSVTVTDNAVSPRDAQYAELRTATQEDLLMALGTPRSVIGDSKGVTFDNADADMENWLRNTVLGHARTIEEGLSILTEGGFLDAKRYVHDISEEAVLQREFRKRRDDASAAYVAGEVSLNYYREIAKLDPIDDPVADVVFISVAGKAAIGDPAGVEKANELKLLAPAPPAQPGAIDPMTGLPAVAPPDPNSASGLLATATGVPTAAADPNAAPGNAQALQGAAGAQAERQAESGDIKALELLLELKGDLPPDLFAELIELSYA